MLLEIDIKQLATLIQHNGEVEAVNTTPFFRNPNAYSSYQGWSVFKIKGKKVVDIESDEHHWNTYKGKFTVNVTVNPYNQVEQSRDYYYGGSTSYENINLNQEQVDSIFGKYKEEYSAGAVNFKPVRDYNYGDEFQDEVKELSRLSKTDGKSLYRKLSKKYHPDTTLDINGESKFKIINEIYNN